MILYMMVDAQDDMIHSTAQNVPLSLSLSLSHQLELFPGLLGGVAPHEVVHVVLEILLGGKQQKQQRRR